MKTGIFVSIISSVAQVSAAERLAEWKGEAVLHGTQQLVLVPVEPNVHATLRNCTTLTLVINGFRSESEAEAPVDIYLGPTTTEEEITRADVPVGSLSFYGWSSRRSGRANLSFPIRSVIPWIDSWRTQDELRVKFVTAERTQTHAAPSFRGVSLWCQSERNRRGG